MLGSAVASLDATVVNVALPTIGHDLNAGISGLQWVVTGYMLTLAALLLTGGSLGDHLGRRRVFVVGVGWFAIASLACAIAPNLGVLLVGRALQGVGGALLTPGSLAIIQASFREEDRGRAIGAWSGLSGVATAIGPFLGGWLIAVSWRLIFLINLPLAAIVVAIAARHIPETRDSLAARRLDPLGATLTVVGLGALTYGLIERAPAATVAGLVALAAFVFVERRSDHPMLPLEVFRSWQFSGANVMTLVLYGALGGAFFLLAIALQGALHYSPTAAGAALIPLTILLLLLSARAGALAQRIGPRTPMTLGPIVAGVGLVLLSQISPGDHYLTDILPGMLVFGLGLSFTVAPLTATVLAAVQVEHAGVASAVNNAVARAAGLLTVAALPALVGLHGTAFERPAAMTTALHDGMLIAAAMAAVAGLVSWLTIRRAEQHVGASHCAFEAPPLRRAS